MNIVKFLYFICLFLIAFSINNLSVGQGRSRGPLEISNPLPEGEVKAFVVGISDYRPEFGDLQLNFADDDAELINNFLKLKSGIDPENIELHLNSGATYSMVFPRLGKLLRSAKEGDYIIVYFACHGAVMQDIEDGYLLMYDIREDLDHEAGGAIRLDRIKEYTEIAVKNKAKVFFISDACRSGLMLDRAHGIEKTLIALNQDWSNSLKLLSCASDEESLESDELGHGVFTYYLVHGLCGAAADIKYNNDTNSITLIEILRYVEDKVLEYTQMRQNPQKTGKGSTVLFEYTDDDRNLEEILFGDTFIDSNSDYLSINKSRSLDAVKRSANLKDYLKKFYTYIENKDYSDCDPPAPTIINRNNLEFKIDNKRERDFFKRKNFNRVYFSYNNTYILLETNNSLEIYSKNPFKLLKSINVPLGVDVSSCLDGSFFAFPEKESVRILNGKTLEEVENGIKHDHLISSIGFSEDNKKIISVDTAGQMMIWNTADWTLHDEIKILGIHDQITNASVSFNGSNILLTDRSGKVIKIDLYNKNRTKFYRKRHFIKSYQYHPSDSIIFAISNRKIIFLNTDLESEKAHVPNVDNNYIFQRRGDYIFYGSKDRINIMYVDSFGIYNNSEDLLIKPRLGCNLKDFNINNNYLICLLDDNTLFAYKLIIKNTDATPRCAYEYYINIITQFPKIDEKVKNFLKEVLYVNILHDVQKIVDQILLGTDFAPQEADISKAIRDLERIEKLYPKDYLYRERCINYKDLLEIYLKVYKKDIPLLDVAIRDAKSLADRKPDAAYTHYLLSVLNKLLNNTLESEQNAREAIHKADIWSEPRSELGHIHEIGGQYIEAEKEYSNIVNLKPYISKGYKDLGDIYSFFGFLDDAQSNIFQAIELESGNPYLYCQQAILEMKYGRDSIAKGYLSKALNKGAEYHLPYLYTGLVNHYSIKKNANLINDSLSFMTDEERDSISSLVAYGYDSTTYTNAINYYIRAYELYPYDPKAYYCLANLYIDQYIIEYKSKGSLRKAIFKSREKKFARMQLNSRIDKLYDKALKYGKFDPYLYSGYLYSLKLSKNKLKFLKIRRYLTSNKVDPKFIKDKAKTNFSIGYYYFMVKNKSKAKKYFKKSISSNVMFLPSYIGLLKVHKRKQNEVLNRIVQNFNDNYFYLNYENLDLDFMLFHNIAY